MIACQSGGEHTIYIADRAFAQGCNGLMVGRKHEIEELNKFVCKKENADRFKFKGIYTV